LSRRAPLKQTISEPLSSKPPYQAVRDFVTLSHHIATLYPQNKKTSGSFNPTQFGSLLNDLAMDCVASFLERNEQGAYVQLCRYFTSAHWSTLTEAELLGQTRRLVFSKVNQELYRLYSS
jgi:hypothetical protein